ncbi:MAG: hypothetical protein RL065_542 [Bacteroidota bacterium]
MINKLFISIIFFLSLQFSSKAQLLYSFGADSNDVISNIVLDKFGNFYVAANFSNTIILEKSSNQKISSKNHSQDILLAKFNAFGKLIWFRKIGSAAKDEIHDLKMDTYGNLFLVGYFNEECNFESPSKKTNLISNGKTDGFVAKYISTTGDLDWAFQIGGENNDDIQSICIDKADGILVSGRFTKKIDADNSAQQHLLISTADKTDYTTAFIARYNAYDAKFIFATTIGITNNNNSFQSQSCVEADEKNYYYLLTTFTDEIDINPNGSPIKYASAGKNDLVLIKFDINGKIIESTVIGGTENEICNNKCMGINKSNEIIIAFSYQSNCKIEGKKKSVTLSAKAESDLAIIKFNNKLSEIIFNTSLSQNGVMANNQILIDDNNQIWLAGYSKLKFKTPADKNQKTSSSIYVAPLNNYFIYHLNNEGKIMTQKTNSNLTENCAFHSLQYNCFSHDLYVTGNYSSSFIWGDFTFKSKGKKDFFVFKLKDDFSNWKLSRNDTSSNLTTDNFSIDVKTNAQSTLLNIKYFADKSKNQNISLIDYQGKIIKQILAPKQSSGLQQIFYDISFLAAGEYFIKQDEKFKCFIKN